MWKWLLGVMVVLALGCAGGGWWAFETGKVGELQKMVKREPPPKTVRMTLVNKGLLTETVSAPGEIGPRTTVKVGAQVSSRVIALPFEEGAEVKAGDVVCRLDDRDVKAALDASRASLRSEQARLEGAQAEYTRAKAEVERRRSLHGSQDVSRAALEIAEAEFIRAESNLRSSEASIEIAAANIARAERDLDNTVIRAPMDGVIVKMPTRLGEQVLGTFSNEGTVIMEIADLNTMLLRAQLDDTKIAQVAVGQKARVYANAYPDDVFDGVVEKIRLFRQFASDGTGFYEVEIVVNLPDPRMRRVGLPANTDIEVATLYDVITVPSQAVLDRRVDELPKEVVEGNTQVDLTKAFCRVVFKLQDGKVKATPVTIGPSDLTSTVIVAGLSEGDRVVTGPYRVLMDLKHDTPVLEEGQKDPADKAGEQPATEQAAAPAADEKK